MLNQINTSPMPNITFNIALILIIVGILAFVTIRLKFSAKITHGKLAFAIFYIGLIGGCSMGVTSQLLANHKANQNQNTIANIQTSTNNNIEQLETKIQAEQRTISTTKNQLDGYVQANNQAKILEFSQKINQHQDNINNYQNKIKQQKNIVAQAKKLAKKISD